jgi:hypothetical protein
MRTQQQQQQQQPCRLCPSSSQSLQRRAGLQHCWLLQDTLH